MRLSYLGWCCALDCREEATKRAQIQAGDGPVLLVPVCDEHLTALRAGIESLRGHEIAMLTRDGGAA